MDSYKSFISTILINGFHVLKVERLSESNFLITAKKFEKLGAVIKYTFLFSTDTVIRTDPLINTLEKVRVREESKPIIISDIIESDKCQVFKINEFYDELGGYFNTGLILIPDLERILDELGHNKLPKSLNGSPDNLHEVYVSESLQFILDSPTRRYGKDRLFESLPDGVVLCKGKFMILLDSKAYSDGFKFSADDIKRFGSYVEDFNNRYSSLFGRVYSFLIVSGHFEDSFESIQNRSSELYKICQCELTCITSSDLAKITNHLKKHPMYIHSLDWKSIFKDRIVSLKQIQKEIQRIKKDKIAN